MTITMPSFLAEYLPAEITIPLSDLSSGSAWLDGFINVLKFIANWILPPGIFIIAMVWLIYKLVMWAKNRLAVFAGIVLVLMYLAASPLCSAFLLRQIEGKYQQPIEPEGDVIVMLGGGSLGNVPDVDGIGALTASPSSRLLTAYRLYKKLNLPIIVSGGSVYEGAGSEAEIAKRILKSLGVTDDKIIVEDKSLTTGQNARFCSKIIDEKGFTAPLLVTSAYHMPRAVLNFEKNNINVTAYPTDYLASPAKEFRYLDLAPSADALAETSLFFREKLRYWFTYLLE